MAELAEPGLEQGRKRVSDRVMAISVTGAHTLEHIYGRSFQVLVPVIALALSLPPFQIGLLEAVRLFTSGVVSMASGFFVDILAHRRGQILAFSFALIAVGYFLAAIAPSYTLILIALALASAGSALWHPPALGLLAERYPEQKGLYISLHRSTGNIGDAIGPLLVGALLGYTGWQWIAGGGAPVMLIVSALILIFLWNIGGPKPEHIAVGQKFRSQLISAKDAMKGTGMASVFTVSALRGMGDASLIWVIPAYLLLELEKSPLVMALHVAFLAAPGIISGPLFGALSDRIGRKPIIVFIMATAVVLPIVMVLGAGNIVTTLAIAAFGLFYFTVNSLTQAAAIDIAEGKRLEGTFIGLMWGSNALFGAGTAIVAGLVASKFGWEPTFYLASGIFFVGFIASLLMPSTGRSTSEAA
jgi:MFS family permease